MGEGPEITGEIVAENFGTLIQIDTDKGRMFVPTRDILKALNNFLYTAWDRKQLDMGAERIDPEAPPYGLID